MKEKESTLAENLNKLATVYEIGTTVVELKDGLFDISAWPTLAAVGILDALDESTLGKETNLDPNTLNEISAQSTAANSSDIELMYEQALKGLKKTDKMLQENSTEELLARVPARVGMLDTYRYRKTLAESNLPSESKELLDKFNASVVTARNLTASSIYTLAHSTGKELTKCIDYLPYSKELATHTGLKTAADVVISTLTAVRFMGKTTSSIPIHFYKSFTGGVIDALRDSIRDKKETETTEPTLDKHDIMVIDQEAIAWVEALDEIAQTMIEHPQNTSLIDDLKAKWQKTYDGMVEEDKLLADEGVGNLLSEQYFMASSSLDLLLRKRLAQKYPEASNLMNNLLSTLKVADGQGCGLLYTIGNIVGEAGSTILQVELFSEQEKDLHESKTSADQEPIYQVNYYYEDYYALPKSEIEARTLREYIIERVRNEENIPAEQEIKVLHTPVFDDLKEYAEKIRKNQIDSKSSFAEYFTEKSIKLGFKDDEIELSFADCTVDVDFSLEGLDLSNIDFQRTKFIDTNLKGVNFTGANLEGANFKSAKLTEANFTETNLEGANFNGAELEGAIFTEANLKRAKFTNAKNFSLRQLKDATIDTNTLDHNGKPLKQKLLKAAQKVKDASTTPSPSQATLPTDHLTNYRGRSL